MFRRISSRIEDMTPAKSEGYIKLNTLAGQRPLNRPHIGFLKKELADGKFRTGHIAVARFGEREVLVNGQHQCYMVFETGKTITVTIERYECEEEADLYRLFSTFDNHKSRSTKDVIRAAVPLLKNELVKVLPQRQLVCCASSLMYLDNHRLSVTGGIKNSPHTKLQKVELLDKYPKEVIFVCSLPEISEFTWTGLFTAIIATWRVDPDGAAEFWPRVLVGAELARESIEFKLRKMLLDESRAKNMQGGWQVIISMHCACVDWWNSYASGRQRMITKVRKGIENYPVPIKLGSS